MPTYVYKYRRRYGRRYSRYRRYGAYSRYRRRRSGTSSTASSRGRIRVRVPVQQLVTLTVPANTIDSNVLTSSPFYHSTTGAPLAVCGAVSQNLYLAYTNLYDQVKCDGVVSNLSVVTPIGGTGATAALQVVMAYDRAGTREELLNSDASQPGLSVGRLFNFSSAVSRSAINNSVAKMSRSCWASDIQERTQFHDSTVFVSAASNQDRDYAASASKVSYFAPMVMVGVRLAAAAPTSATTVQVLLEQVYYFTFRQPKYGGDPSASANTKMATIPITMDTRTDMRDIDDGALADDGGLDDEDATAAAPVPSAPRRDMSIYWKDAQSTPLPQ
ncbi:putative capsid protein [Hudisavirus runais]|uniref:Putative capsid protein n=1 Tax=Hudisavirus sp. TaxID=2021738 RepID=A0A223Q5U7_9VIRU|nr:putative capsid protein [Hudisavirus sp.]